jgi:hypothetical protein
MINREIYSEHLWSETSAPELAQILTIIYDSMDEGERSSVSARISEYDPTSAMSEIDGFVNVFVLEACVYLVSNYLVVSRQINPPDYPENAVLSSDLFTIQNMETLSIVFQIWSFDIDEVIVKLGCYSLRFIRTFSSLFSTAVINEISYDYRKSVMIAISTALDRINLITSQSRGNVKLFTDEINSLKTEVKRLTDKVSLLEDEVASCLLSA